MFFVLLKKLGVYFYINIFIDSDPSTSLTHTSMLSTSYFLKGGLFLDRISLCLNTPSLGRAGEGLLILYRCRTTVGAQSLVVKLCLVYLESVSLLLCGEQWHWQIHKVEHLTAFPTDEVWVRMRISVIAYPMLVDCYHLCCGTFREHPKRVIYCCLAESREIGYKTVIYILYSGVYAVFKYVAHYCYSLKRRFYAVGC